MLADISTAIFSTVYWVAYDFTVANSCRTRSTTRTSRSAVAAAVGSRDIAPAACCSVRNSRRRVAGFTPRVTADCTRPWTSRVPSVHQGLVQSSRMMADRTRFISATGRVDLRHLGRRRRSTRSIRPSSSRASHASLTTSPRRRAVMPARSASCRAVMGSSARVSRMRTPIEGSRVMAARTLSALIASGRRRGLDLLVRHLELAAQVADGWDLFGHGGELWRPLPCPSRVAATQMQVGWVELRGRL